MTRHPLLRTGLLLPAVGAYGCALLGTLLPQAVPAAAIAALAAAGLTLAARRSRRHVLLLAGLVACGATLFSIAVREPGRHPDGLPAGQGIAIEVRVASATRATGNGVTGGLTGRRVVRGDLVRADGRAVGTPVVLFADGARLLAQGVVVAGVAELARAEPWDGAAYLGRVRGGLRVVERAPPAQAGAQALRSRFSAAAARLPGDGGALLPGLAIGDTAAVGPDLTQAMRDSSLSHLTAVSGANCAVVVVGVLALGGALRLRRGIRVALAAAALAGFVVLVTPQPSVVRAAAMAAVALACIATGRRALGVPVLALAVLVLLLADPWVAWSVGFLLSVLATGGLLLLAPPLADRFARVLPPRVALLLAVPVAAQIACTPVLVLLQPRIPVFGVLANVLAESAAPVATVLGLVACLAGPVCPPLAAGLALLAWIPAAWIALVARAVARLPAVDWPVGAAGLLLAAALVVVALVAAARTPPRRVRIAAVTLLVAGAVALAGAVAGGAIGRIAGTPRDWTLAACDVGQGDGLVLRGGDGRYAVVDTGREPGPILACLDRLGVRRIDLLVLTHWDADHVGAARSIAARARVALVGPSDGVAADSLRRDLARAGAHVVQARRGATIRVGALRLDVLWPPDPLGGVEPGNAASVTLLVSGPLTALMTGDLGEQAQDALLAAGPLPRVEVMKVAHHGSSDQSPAFYAAAGAVLGVISVGADNDYGHPTARLLGILRATGTAAVRTDQDGLVLVGARSGRLWVWTEHPVTSAVWRPAGRR